MLPRNAIVHVKRRITRSCVECTFRRPIYLSLPIARLYTGISGGDTVQCPNENELEELVKNLEDLYSSSVNSTPNQIAPDGKTLSLHKIISQCAQMSTVRGAELAERVLWLAIGDDQDSCTKKHYPRSRLSSSSLSNLDLNPDPTEEKQKAIIHKPSKEMFTMAINAWASVSAYYSRQPTAYLDSDLPMAHNNTNIVEDAANRALQILDFMWEEYHRYNAHQDKILGSNIRYQRYMHRLEDELNERRRPVPPDAVHYTAVMEAIVGNIHSRGAPHQASRLLKQMEELSGIEEIRSYCEPSEAGNMPLYLDQLLDLDRGLIPDRVCYHTVLNAWCRNRVIPISDKVSAMRQIINNMVTFAKVLQDDTLMPNTRTYNLLIMAYGSYSPEKDLKLSRGNEATKILQEMISLNNNQAYTSVVEDDCTNDDQGNSTLPNTKTYNAIINAWSLDSSNIGVTGPLQAERILFALIQNISASFSTREDLDIPISPSVLPDIATFNSVITAWARSKVDDAGMRAEKIMEFMRGSSRVGILENEVLQQNGFVVEPDTITFNGLVSSWCQSNTREAVDRAFNILTFMISEYNLYGHYKPTVSSIAATIDKLAQSIDVDRGDKADFVLNALLQNPKYIEEYLYPLRPCFSKVIEIWSSSISRKGIGNKALHSLHLLQKHYTPTIDDYNNTLTALSSDIASNYDEAYYFMTRSQQLLIDIIDDYERDKSNPAPNIHSFHHVLRACNNPNLNYSSTPVQVIAMETFELFDNLPYCDRDAQTYVIMFKIVSHQSVTLCNKEEFDDLCDRLFERCCDEGLVTNAVLKIISNHLPALAEKLNGKFKKGDYNSNDSLSVKDLPLDWSCYRRKGQNQKRNRRRTRS